jgi:hypothetical protein
MTCQNQLFTPHNSGAVMSASETYRYLLWRMWDGRPPLVFVLLNPSTADASVDDQTVRLCIRRAAVMGYGGVRIINLFALRATDPGALYTHPDPIGANNNLSILEAVRDAGMVICGWGRHGNHLNRANVVLGLLESKGIAPHCLRVNKDGTPSHPLYLPGNIEPIPYSLLEVA